MGQGAVQGHMVSSQRTQAAFGLGFTFECSLTGHGRASQTKQRGGRGLDEEAMSMWVRKTTGD